MMAVAALPARTEAMLAVRSVQHAMENNSQHNGIDNIVARTQTLLKILYRTNEIRRIRTFIRIFLHRILSSDRVSVERNNADLFP
jgi:hypothetical protein